MKSSSLQTRLVRLITIALLSAVLGATWDIWWHSTLGRETFWSPPHVMLYSGVIVAIAAGLYGWWKMRDARSKWLALTLLLIPGSGPFDELWHRIFGKELVSSPLIVWSPPHIAIALTFIIGFSVLFFRLRADENVIARHLLQSAALAAILSLLFFLISPLEPMGPHHLLGFAGAGFGSGLVALFFVLSQQWMQRFASAVSVAGMFMLLSAMDFDHQVKTFITGVSPHEHSPGWLMIFACLAPALLIDLLHSRPVWLKSSLVGLLHGGILYGFSWKFFEQEFQYSANEMWTGISASILAGFAVGIALTFIPRLPSLSNTSP